LIHFYKRQRKWCDSNELVQAAGNEIE